MKLRGPIIVVLVLAVGTIAAWVWFANREKSPAAPAAADTVYPTLDPANSTGAPAAAASATRDVTPPPSQTPAALPTEPVRITSSVSPGMPLVRSVPTVSRPVVATLPVGAREAASRPDPQAEGKADLEGVRFMFRDFRTRMGENPVGSNAEMMRAIMGGNPAKANLGPPPGQSLNEQGELVDRWGTAYFFHQISKTRMEIRSAGPDRKLWTPDDVVGK